MGKISPFDQAREGNRSRPSRAEDNSFQAGKSASDLFPNLRASSSPRPADRPLDRHSDRPSERPTDRHSDRPTDRPQDRPSRGARRDPREETLRDCDVRARGGLREALVPILALLLLYEFVGRPLLRGFFPEADFPSFLESRVASALLVFLGL